MKPTIRFRGYHKTTRTWCYGDLIQPKRGNVRAVILMSAACNGGWLMPLSRAAVAPESVGQFIGVRDEKGIEIYSGDIVTTDCPTYQNMNDMWVVEFGNNGSFNLSAIPMRSYKESIHDLVINKWKMKVIANTHENPELMK